MTLRFHVAPLLAMTTVAALAQIALGQTAKHPFNLDDMAAIRSADPQAVSPKGDILYIVSHGAASGPMVNEWHSIMPNGSGEKLLELPAAFRPFGFTQDGDLYGSFEVNGTPQLAIFGFSDIGKKSLPK